MEASTLKLYFPKQKPNIQNVRDYKRFQTDFLDQNLIMKYQNLLYVT